MTKEEKQLLLKDLCARLLYLTKIHGPKISDDISWELDFRVNITQLIDDGWKPYLRPMSSMTEEEINEFTRIDDALRIDNPNVDYYFYCANIEQIDWLNAHHFDYRGLIPMGLALEALEGMYKN